MAKKNKKSGNSISEKIVELSHDAYKKDYGIAVLRNLSVDLVKNCVMGEDMIIPDGKSKKNLTDAIVSLYFHMHPSIVCKKMENGVLIKIPGDKSISHRALILGALTVGETIARGLLESEDVMSTANALEILGAKIVRKGSGFWSIQGVGIGGFRQPDNVIDCGNSGTSVRLLMGAVSTSFINVTFTGDNSLRKRPMDRVLIPLSGFGTSFSTNVDNKLPIHVSGSEEPIPISYKLPVPSAQVKSAILLGGLNARGRTTVVETEASRDHTEKMLKAFGANILIEKNANCSKIVTKVT